MACRLPERGTKPPVLATCRGSAGYLAGKRIGAWQIFTSKTLTLELMQGLGQRLTQAWSSRVHRTDPLELSIRVWLLGIVLLG